MSDTYSYEVLEPGGHARLVGNVLDRISEASANPASAVGSSRALLGDPETASWMERTTAADGAALIEAIYGNTLRWNQLMQPNVGQHTMTVGLTLTVEASGKVSYTGTTTTSGGRLNAICRPFSIINGHKYALRDTLNYSAGNSTGWFLSRTSDSTVVNAQPIPANSIYAVQESTNVIVGKNVSANETYDCSGYVSVYDLTAMFGAGNEPSTVAEFEALFPLPYYPYDPGSLLPVRMEGVETVGFNQWDEVWEKGGISSSTGVNNNDGLSLRSKNYIPVSPATEYFAHIGATGMTGVFKTRFYDADKSYLGYVDNSGAQIYPNTSFVTPANAFYMRFQSPTGYGDTYHDNICINVSDPSRNGEYEPYWSSQRTIPAATYFPGGMRGVGTGDTMVCDELLTDAAIHRVYEVVLDGSQSNLRYAVNASSGSSRNMTVVTVMGNSWVLEGLPQPLKAGEYLSRTSVKCDKLPTMSTEFQTWTGKGISGWPDNSAAFILAPTGDNSITTEAELKEWLSQNPLTIHYALATPTTTPIDPPLPLSYRVGAGGTERVMVASGTTSAPPVFATRYPLDPADLAASIAPVDGPIAKTNHQVGDLIMLGFTLCKVTTAIARGEAITIGTNVTRTSVAAEIAALS